MSEIILNWRVAALSGAVYHTAVTTILLGALFAAIPASADVLREEIDHYEALLSGGDWGERVYAVNQLGRKGRPGWPGLLRGLRDPDWQIRLNAVLWLGQTGLGGREIFERTARQEKCPWVRLAALNRLGAAAQAPRFSRAALEDREFCQGWSGSLMGAEQKPKKAEMTGATTLDEAGCRSLRYKGLSADVCPKGTILRGTGLAPYPQAMLLGRPENSGVALCCPGAPSGLPDFAASGRAVEVECRLVPEDCPAGWISLEGIDGEGSKFQRTRRHREGDLNWVQCCRPQKKEEETAAAAPAAPPRDKEREKEPPKAGSSYGIGGTQAAISREDRALQIDALIERLAEELAAPEPIPELSEASVSSEPTLERAASSSQAPSLEARPAPTEEESLGWAKAPAPRKDERVSGTQKFEGDHGRGSVLHDSVPELLRRLESKKAVDRARAAEALGAAGEKGRSAVSALREALRDSDPRVKANSAIALGNLTRSSDEAVGDLTKLLGEKNPDVRYAAAQALGRIGTEGSEKAFARSMRSGMRVFLGVKQKEER